jgi:hypothetical protein
MSAPFSTTVARPASSLTSSRSSLPTGRVDVLVQVGVLGQGRDVQPGLVGEGGVADVGGVGAGRLVHDLRHPWETWVMWVSAPSPTTRSARA